MGPMLKPYLLIALLCLPGCSRESGETRVDDRPTAARVVHDASAPAPAKDASPATPRDAAPPPDGAPPLPPHLARIAHLLPVASIVASSSKLLRDHPKGLTIDRRGTPLIDGNWCEDKPGVGIGESLTITFFEPQPIDNLWIDVGFETWDGELAREYDLVREITLTTDDGQKVVNDKTFDGEQSRTIILELDNSPVRTIELVLSGIDESEFHDACIRVSPRIDNRFRAMIYKVDQPPLESAYPRLLATWEALNRCDIAALGPAENYPVTWDIYGRNDAQDRSYKLRSRKQMRARCQKAIADASKKYEKMDPDFDVAPAVGDASVTVTDPPHHNPVPTLKWSRGEWRLVRVRMFPSWTDY